MAAPLHKLAGLFAVFLAACGGGSATTPGPGSGGSAGTDSGAGGVQGTGGVDGTAGAGGTPSTAGTAGAGGGAGSAALSFVADIWPVFDEVRDPPFVYRMMGTYDGCTTNGVCHGGATPGARLSMTDSDTAYRALFEVASTTSLCVGAGGTVRVIPGDPDRSCLVLFYERRLRDDLQWVGQAEIDLVRRWIAQGARP